MAKEKYIRKQKNGGSHLRKRRHTKRRTTLLSVLLILSLAVGGTLAYIVDRTNHVNNTFVPAYVTCTVNANANDTFDVTNTGNIDAYIRAAIAVNWMDSAGNVRGIAPTTAEYELDVNSDDWWQDTATGYYYYKYRVASRDVTKDLVEDYGITPGTNVPAGYELCVEVVAEAIQADGDTDTGAVPAYQDAWRITSISGN